MFNKKLLMTIGMALGSFLVINVAMFFFLKTTQPKMGARSDTEKVAAVKTADSLAAKEHAAKTDSLPHPELAAATGKDSTLASEIHADSAKIPAETAPVMAAMAEESPSLAPETTKPSPDTAKSAAPTEANASTNAESAVAAAKTGDSVELAKLAKLLESLKPNEAADIASQLNTEQIVALVMKMKDRTAGKMLAALPVEQAARVAAKMSQSVAQTRGRS
jgi:flagellar motility protein MotE (MotC chaperone)